MSKKKDFKGLTSSIVSNKVTSIDDFLGTDDGKPESETPSAPMSAEKQSKPASKPKPSKKAPPMPEEPEKTRISLFLASKISYELDELKMNIRRHAPRSDMSKISKSSIVEAAVNIVKSDFEANGMESELVQKILK